MCTQLKSLTILYVEDDDAIRKNAVEYLSRLCAKVYEAEDGVHALRVYHDKHPDIIISDIQMPRLNGLDFAKQIRQHDKTTPIIIATAHTETKYLLKAVELQLIKYIVKPITAKNLQESLALACEHLGGTNLIHIDTHTLYDSMNHTLSIQNNFIKLTKNEALLLDLLAKNHHRCVSYREIENLIWADSGMSMDALRSLVRALRKKLQGDYINNISGAGYTCKIVT